MEHKQSNAEQELPPEEAAPVGLQIFHRRLQELRETDCKRSREKGTFNNPTCCVSIL